MQLENNFKNPRSRPSVLLLNASFGQVLILLKNEPSPMLGKERTSHTVIARCSAQKNCRENTSSHGS